MSSPNPCWSPIFVLGIHFRSGTNFLYDLLCLHPSCDASTPLPEDYLLDHADLLVEYVDSVSWTSRTHCKAEVNQDMLFQCLGGGLASFLVFTAWY
jgi:hypothetical protein